ncbi:Amino acid permease family protein [Hibiscus syriacus]|uniref:Amino acid permease family protein n=1 Tax=Hibiscus syriacus TaxID=106335 RepID=A0A6A3BII7_HIBSY|nr:uncharacterized protein LOC120214751 [Hibiscus syriacus]KAE8716846.1 Amino acid permease family protein [Hibiscus syriacus]
MDASTNRNKDPNISCHSPTFLLHNNGFSSISQLSDIEMITIKSVSYTSLKDLMPSSSSSASPPSVAAIASPKVHNSSWHEIPIKNPLVKQAALAYLQPVGSPPVAGEKGLFEKVKERCCGDCGCVSWLYDVVWRKVKEAFSDRRDDDVDDYYDEDDDKVD